MTEAFPVVDLYRVMEDGEGCWMFAARDGRGVLGVVARYEGELAQWCFGSTVWTEVLLIMPAAAGALASRLGVADAGALLDRLPVTCGGEDAFDYIEMLLEESGCVASPVPIDDKRAAITVFTQVDEVADYSQTFLKFLLDARGGP